MRLGTADSWICVGGATGQDPRLTAPGVLAQAHNHWLGTHSPVGSVLKRHQRTACQTVAVVDDPSDWFREHAEPRYILDLLTRVVTVSVGTVEIVESLSNLEFGPKEAPIP